MESGKAGKLGRLVAYSSWVGGTTDRASRDRLRQGLLVTPRRARGRATRTILQFLLIPQRPTPELVDGLGDPRRVAEDRHVRGVLEHQQTGPRLRRDGRRGAAETTRPVGATLHHSLDRESLASSI